MTISPTHKKLDDLAIKISECRVCDNKGIRVSHAPPLQRGSPSQILVIGIEPGSTELRKGVAFSGPGGKRLKSWLSKIGLGNDDATLFANIYFTSLCKCKNDKPNTIPKAVRNCFPFLQQQIDILQPRLVLTLGLPPLLNLFGYKGSLDDIIGGIYQEGEIRPDTLIPLLPEGTWIAPLPHPSPLSRWLNDSENRKTHEQLLQKIKKLLEGGL